MTKYLSTFTTAFEDLIPPLLQDKFPGARILQTSPGAILYQTSDSTEKIKQAKFLSNTFLVINHFNAPVSLPELVSSALADISPGYLAPSLPAKAKTFRIIYSVESQMTSLDPDSYSKLTHVIDTRLHLKFGGPQADVEFWIIVRKNGLTAFGLRLTRPHEKLAKGSLPSDVAYLLNFLSEPHKSDIFLDPFAGSGSIPLERYYHKGFRQITAGDLSDDHLQTMRTRFNKALATKIQIQKINALELPFQDNSIDKIVTDPPWGIFQTLADRSDFYRQLLREFSKVLKENGLLVLLVSRDIDISSFLPDKSLKIIKRYDILLSGQKASVYQLRRTV